MSHKTISQYFRLRLFLIVEHNDNRSTYLYDIIMTSHERHNSLFGLTTTQYQSRIADEFPHKGPVMWRSRVRASPYSIMVSDPVFRMGWLCEITC